MASRLRVTPEQLDSVRQQIEGLISNYQSIKNKITQTVDNLTQIWQGEAQAQYAQRVHGFDDDFENLFNLLNHYTAYLDNASRNYKNTEENIKGNAQSLSIGK